MTDAKKAPIDWLTEADFPNTDQFSFNHQQRHWLARHTNAVLAERQRFRVIEYSVFEAIQQSHARLEEELASCIKTHDENIDTMRDLQSLLKQAGDEIERLKKPRTLTQRSIEVLDRLLALSDDDLKKQFEEHKETGIGEAIVRAIGEPLENQLQEQSALIERMAEALREHVECEAGMHGNECVSLGGADGLIEALAAYDEYKKGSIK